MYAFTPDQQLCLVYEDFYLAIGYTFYEFIKLDELVKNVFVSLIYIPFHAKMQKRQNLLKGFAFMIFYKHNFKNLHTT